LRRHLADLAAGSENDLSGPGALVAVRLRWCGVRGS
jgi:hypothetical protein